MIKRLLLVGLTAALAACASVDISEYAENDPRLVPETFFDGKLEAHGIVKDRDGKVIRYFTAEIDAYWEDGIGTLDERFVFDDGERQTRVWKLRQTSEDEYVATAGDVIGDGKMTIAGNALFLDYILRIPYDGDTIDLRIDDRMYRVSDKVLLNESIMTKVGFEVGQITLVIVKL